jgi:hypothetical protein
MTTDLEIVTHLLSQRINAMQKLSSEIRAAQQSFVDLDLDGIEKHTACQAALCSEITAIDEQLQPPDDPPGQARRATIATSLRNLLEENRKAQQHAGQVTRIFADFLKRSRLSFTALSNIHSYAQGTYGEKPHIISNAPTFERSC